MLLQNEKHPCVVSVALHIYAPRLEKPCCNIGLTRLASPTAEVVFEGGTASMHATMRQDHGDSKQTTMSLLLISTLITLQREL